VHGRERNAGLERQSERDRIAVMDVFADRLRQ